MKCSCYIYDKVWNNTVHVCPVEVGRHIGSVQELEGKSGGKIVGPVNVVLLEFYSTMLLQSP